jgi:hypothetical protein
LPIIHDQSCRALLENVVRIYIPARKVANLDPLAFMSTYSLPNRAFAEKVSEVARQYVK